jgi:hypothetical protein
MQNSAQVAASAAQRELSLGVNIDCSSDARSAATIRVDKDKGSGAQSGRSCRNPRSLLRSAAQPSGRRHSASPSAAAVTDKVEKVTQQSEWVVQDSAQFAAIRGAAKPSARHH